MSRYTTSALIALFLFAASAVGQQPAHRFDRWDRNGDGRLTQNELPQGLRANFDRVDTNDDGFISRAEDEAVGNRSSEGRPRQRQALPVADGIVAKRDLAYADTDDPRQRLDLYLPKNPASDGPLPLVIWIHGGGWQGGNKAGGFGHLAPLVASGHYGGASVGYRLSGQAIWPAQTHDCKAAIRWLRAHSAEHGIDAERIGVWGSSAGGHLVAMLGVSGDVPTLDGELGKHTDRRSDIQCVVDYFGPSELLTMDDFPSRIVHNGPNSPESRLVGGPIQEHKAAARAASPVTYVSEGDPPFLILHGTEDALVPFNQSEVLAAALKKAGVDVTFVPVEGAGHGGFPKPQPEHRVRAFFDRHLRGLDVTVSGDPIRPAR